MNRYKKLLSNSLIFTLGNMGSKLLVFILVPLYTYALTPKEYGFADLYQTTASLLLPFIGMNIFDATLRFAMDKSVTKEKVLSNSFVVWCVSFLFSILGITLFYGINLENREDLSLVILIVLFQAAQSILAQYARGTENSKLFALSGIIILFASTTLGIASKNGRVE
ncbi:lipopolysaccharide biosynthesis protein [Streptococcus thermophilus]|nr:oligosaccharide flippase family protein [Streptococcus thermophilus]MCE2063621.1 oligosaccharide flippase family protein [Streptococcus thermophilus]MCE2079965.1 oligosaccharide flippase family protein [Streptococcus thermophilus]MCE2090293.1 oligosaccharide flippase family protein [Streptococcus thermophilus]